MNSEMGKGGFDLWCGGAVYGSGRSARTNGYRLSRCVWSIHAGGRPGGGVDSRSAVNRVTSITA